MRILICNDDGVMAPGIKALAARLSKEHDVTVVAPSKEQSGVGHSITFFSPIYSRPYSIPGVDVKAFAVDGSPVDCVKFGLGLICPETPDLVVTGINQGANSGVDIFPSGTVNSAIAGVIHGVPAIAVSLDDFLSSEFETSAEYAARVVNFVMEHPIPKGMLLNLNVPSLPLEKIKGIRVVPMNTDGYPFHFDTREDPMNRSYHWLVPDREFREQTEEPDNDCDAILSGYASLTPIKIDMSDYEYIEVLKNTGYFD